jgi:hypothetical protein
MALTNFNMAPVDFSPLANIGLAYADSIKQKEQQAQQQQTITQAQEIMKSGDFNQMADFALANPELGKTMFELGGIRDEAAQKRMTELSKGLTVSQSPVEDLTAYIQSGEQQGRDMSHSKSLLDKSQGNPEALKQMAETSWASADPKTYKSYRTTLPEKTGMTDYQSAMVSSKQVDQDLRREESIIKREEMKLDRETDELKRDEIKNKIDASKQKVEAVKVGAAQESKDAIQKLDETSMTINRLLEGDSLESATGWQANFPTVSGTKAASFEAMLETLQSQAFLSQVSQMKGMGALSENEGKKLGQAIGSLSVNMSDANLRKELLRINETLEIAKIKAKNKMLQQPQPAKAEPAVNWSDL